MKEIVIEISDTDEIPMNGTPLSEVLNEMAAEIKALSNANPSYWHSGDMVNRDDVLAIIDKYREEQK